MKPPPSPLKNYCITGIAYSSAFTKCLNHIPWLFHTMRYLYVHNYINNVLFNLAKTNLNKKMSIA